MSFFKKVLFALISSLTLFIGNVFNLPRKRGVVLPLLRLWYGVVFYSVSLWGGNLQGEYCDMIVLPLISHAFNK